jgi:hypothetical protein
VADEVEVRAGRAAGVLLALEHVLRRKASHVLDLLLFLGWREGRGGRKGGREGEGGRGKKGLQCKNVYVKLTLFSLNLLPSFPPSLPPSLLPSSS